ncbi:Ankyrin repeat protein SKIP35 [Capsicum chinense]|nr:Ankyrin repeat protein SKIP35 [Capsicum chinense]
MLKMEDIQNEEEIVVLPSEKGQGSNGNVVFSREAPLVHKDFRAGGCSCGVNNIKSRLANSDSELGISEKSRPEKKLSRQERIELGRLFQGAVSGRDWELAEHLILLTDPQTLNDALCIALDSI